MSTALIWVGRDRKVYKENFKDEGLAKQECNLLREHGVRAYLISNSRSSNAFESGKEAFEKDLIQYVLTGEWGRSQSQYKAQKHRIKNNEWYKGYMLAMCNWFKN